LDFDPTSDPAWRQTVICGFDFDTAIQMHHPFAVLVIAERFYRQREQGWFFFCEHGGHLPFGGAVNARIGPVRFPAIQIGLPFLQALEAFSLTYPPAAVNVLDVSSESMAAFQVFMYGRFWVFTEVISPSEIRITAIKLRVVSPLAQGYTRRVSSSVKENRY
jgi:hypothetical protein